MSNTPYVGAKGRVYLLKCLWHNMYLGLSTIECSTKSSSEASNSFFLSSSNSTPVTNLNKDITQSDPFTPASLIVRFVVTPQQPWRQPSTGRRVFRHPLNRNA